MTEAFDVGWNIAKNEHCDKCGSLIEDGEQYGCDGCGDEVCPDCMLNDQYGYQGYRGTMDDNIHPAYADEMAGGGAKCDECASATVERWEEDEEERKEKEAAEEADRGRRLLETDADLAYYRQLSEQPFFGSDQEGKGGNRGKMLGRDESPHFHSKFNPDWQNKLASKDSFESAWNVLKDFYHDPNEPGTKGIARLWRHGEESEKRDRGASFARTRMEEHLQGRGSRKVAGSALPDQVGMKPMHVRQAGDTSYTAGVNLQSDEAQSHAAGLANEDPQVANEAFNQFVSGSGTRSGFGDDSGAAGTLLHEHGHGLMHDELSETHESGFWGNTAGAKKQKSRAHEIGAYSLQYPGGPLEEVAAQRRVQQHPDANKVPLTGGVWNGATQQWEKPKTQMPRVPRPAYNQYDKYGDEESGWEQEVTDKLQSNHPLVYANTRQGTDRRWAEENPGVQGRLRPGL